MRSTTQLLEKIYLDVQSTMDRWSSVIDTFRKIDAMGADTEDDLLLSWVLHYDPLSKSKTPVDGYCIYMPSTNELYIEINDADRGTEDSWSLDVKPCKSSGLGKPVFIATNVDLGSWEKT